MYKNVSVEIDPSSWPRGRTPPRSLIRPAYRFNIPSVLLQIGELTTPPYRGGISLSEYWAYVRYFNALTTSPLLELTREFGSLDPHQKTILSDDFGVGFSISYLRDTLNLQAPVNGQFFINSMLGATGATYTGKEPKKRGPGKSPDFVAIDNRGMWHVVECKGTQSNLEYSKRQLLSGVNQKNTVSFPAHVRGECLVAGLFIASENSSESSTLIIRDPEPEKPFVVPEDDLSWAKDTLNRGLLATALQKAGLPATASMVAAPMGPELNSRISKFAKTEGNRRETLQAKRSNSINELEVASDRPVTDGYIGRAAEFDLPGLKELTDGKMTKIKISNRVSVDVLKRLLKPNEYESRPTLELQTNIHADELKRVGISDNNVAEISYGGIYKARLELIR